MNQKSTQKYHHGDLRTALIEATVEMINTQGVEQITMRNLSEWVGVSRTAAYRHFADKADLLTATAIAGFEQFGLALKTARTDVSMNEIDRFRRMGEAYTKFAMENPAYYRLMFGNIVVQQNEALAAASTKTFDELLMMIQMLQEIKAISREDPKMQATYIWSLMHGLSSLIIDNKLQTDTELKDLMVFIDHQIQKSLSD